ncbi:MAG TPA: SCP2 sterol-binding domain-containing protein [Polyangia bacterium]|jgi:SCP-2 sterol transfer family|nr:SCP2 sterol-binding domain-containing protein [Polyangia bacterium]
MSSSSWNRPPAGITVAAFFRDWLPQAFRTSGRAAPADAPLVRAQISGDGAAASAVWDLQARADALAVTEVAPGPGAPRPDVLLRQSAPDLLAALSPEPDPDLPELLPPGWSVLDLLFLDPRDVDLLRQVSGRVLVEVAGRRRRRWAFDVGFGDAGVSAGRPRATVRLDGATFDGLRRSTIPPMQALLDGRLKLEGDRTLAMQLLLLLGSRLSRR